MLTLQIKELVAKLEQIDKSRKIHQSAFPLGKTIDRNLRHKTLFKGELDLGLDKVYSLTKDLADFVLDSVVPNSYGIARKAIPLIEEMAQNDAFKTTADFMSMSMESFLEMVYSLWFQSFQGYAGPSKDHSAFYNRSGFAHHFLGEYDPKGVYSGMHSWFGLYLREMRGDFQVVNIEQRYDLVYTIDFCGFNSHKVKKSTVVFLQSPDVAICLYTFALFNAVDPFCDANRKANTIRVDVVDKYQLFINFAHGHLITAYCV